MIADAPVAERYLPALADGLAARGLGVVHLGVPEGEEAKSLQVMNALERQLATQEAHRDDPIVALGGGAVGDLAGFVAATYMRGVPFVQVPTTLTAQVDAAIGGKTAVNIPEGKNLVGAFHQPVAVLADVATLATLPDRAFRSGLAEIAKYALTLDLELLELLERDPSPLLGREPRVLEEVVTRCVRAKAAVVAADERDTGRRLILNYGHTLGHALERQDAFAGRTHGEAISAGMVFAARLSEALGRGTPGLAARHVRLLASLGLETDATLPPRGGDRVRDPDGQEVPRRGALRAAGGRRSSLRGGCGPGGAAPHHARAGRLGRAGDGGLRMRVLFLFGPNLGALGRREPERYGTQTLEQIMDEVAERGTRLGHELEWRQTDHEGELIGWLNGAGAEGFEAVVANPGALSHTSYALRDAVEGCGLPVIEVHMTNIYAREEFRRHSVISPACRATIAGAGAGGYHVALEALPWITG